MLQYIHGEVQKSTGPTCYQNRQWRSLVLSRALERAYRAELNLPLALAQQS